MALILFILSPEGGEYEIPFTCKAKKFAEGSLVEDGYISLKRVEI